MAFGWFAFPRSLEMRHRLPLLRQLQPQLPACFCLTVQRLRNRGRAAHLTEKHDLNLKLAWVGLYSEEVAYANLARGLGLLSVGRNSAEFTCPCSERAGLKESSGPEPFVHSHVGTFSSGVSPVILTASIPIATVKKSLDVGIEVLGQPDVGFDLGHPADDALAVRRHFQPPGLEGQFGV